MVESKRASRILLSAMLVAALTLLAGCIPETDRDTYVAGEAGIATFPNPSSETRFLPGCAPFVFERQDAGVWTDHGPPFVCFWEGIAVAVAPGDTLETPFNAPSRAGTFRLRYDVSFGCEPGLPISEANCESSRRLYTPPFTVEREKCDATERGCRFAPAAPNILCEDGVSFSGPADVCTRDPETGRCGYEILECP